MYKVRAKYMYKQARAGTEVKSSAKTRDLPSSVAEYLSGARSRLSAEIEAEYERADQLRSRMSRRPVSSPPRRTEQGSQTPQTSTDLPTSFCESSPFKPYTPLQTNHPEFFRIDPVKREEQFADGVFRKVSQRVNHFFLRKPKRPIDPDEELKREKRRIWGGDGGLPSTRRRRYPEGSRAIWSVIAFFIKKYGECTASNAKIAEMSGTSVRYVQRIRKKFERDPLINLQVIQRENKINGRRVAPNLTNVIRLRSRELYRWITRAPRGGRTGVHANQTIDRFFLRPKVAECFSAGAVAEGFT